MVYLFANNNHFYSLFRECYFTTSSVHKKADFIEKINRSSGGGLTLSLCDNEVTEFYHYLKNKFEFEHENNRKVGSSTIGLQEDKQTWILSPTMYLNSVGALLQKSDSKYVWLSHIAMQNAGNSSDINCALLSPHIHFPLSTMYVLQA